MPLNFQKKLPVSNQQIKLKEKQGKTWKIHQSLDELKMNYSVSDLSDTSISYETTWKWNTKCFPTMDETWEQVLYNSRQLTLMFSSASSFQKLLMVFLIFQEALQPKASKDKSCILFSYAMRLKVIKSKILDKGPVPR